MESSSNKITIISPSSSSNSELDRISNLPDGILDRILSLLPIKDAVKTSVLSTKWRYNYATLPNLVFDHRLFDSLYRSKDTMNKFVSIVNHVFLLHSGPIHKFKLQISGWVPIDELQKWLLHLSTRHLKVLNLKYQVPSSMFSCQSLTHLELSSCELVLPSTFAGFENLKSLFLRGVRAYQGVVESLISSTPLLEIVTIIDLFDWDSDPISSLCIDAPNLQQLTVKGGLIHLELKLTSCLNLCSINTNVFSKSHVPSSVFSCQRLTHLELSDCELDPPLTFTGFKNLKSLILKKVKVNQGVLESLISSSPLLEIFTLINLSSRNLGPISHLCIDAPNLQRLAVKGNFIHLKLKNTSRLNVCSIDTKVPYILCEDEVFLEKLFAGMPQIQRLDLGVYFLWCITLGAARRAIPVPVPLVNLKYLSIGMSFTDYKELHDLLKCAPNLHELHICWWGDYKEESSSVLESDVWNGPFSLRHIKVKCISGFNLFEMDFIKFMLLNSPALETMTINFDFGFVRIGLTEAETRLQVVQRLSSFRRASPVAKIIFS